MKKTLWLFIILTFLFPFSEKAENTTLTAFDILDKIDQNMVYTTAYSEIEMIITIKNRTITKQLTSYAQGNDKSFIEVLSPARDKGTKILKIDDVVKTYYPSAERVMRLSGHMLRQSMMGSDFSYEDMTERSKKMREEYTGEILEDESFQNTLCYVLRLTSKLEKQTYYTRKIWVDKKLFVGLKEELYAKSGKLLKVMTIDEIKHLDDRSYPTHITMEDKLRKDSRTEMILKKIEFDIDIPEETFSERQLTKK